MLGDSLRRRRKPDKRKRTPPEEKGSVLWGGIAAAGEGPWRWIGIAAAILIAAFGVGYGAAVFVVFPLPDEGAAGVPVPSVVGRTYTDAERDLRTAGLAVVRTAALPVSDEGPGIVVAQNPLPGQQLPRGATVELGVSAEDVRVRIPDVTGFDVDRAAELLVRLGFGIARTERVSGEPAGRVLEVDPAPGTDATLPTTVRLSTSTGPPEPLVPDSFEAVFDTMTFPLMPAPVPEAADTPASGGVGGDEPNP